jgi:hypothetical protein
MPLMTPQIHDMLDRETDARFWAQTGMAPGRKLDPKNKIDAAFIPVWLDIFKKVKAEWSSGKFVKTYDHPAVVLSIQEAAASLANAAQSVSAALDSTETVDKNAHAADAAAAHAKANAATTKAATYQPPTASPQLAQHAADQVMSHVMTPTPDPAAPEALPQPEPISVHEAIDALQSSHAPAKAAATQEQEQASDAPKLKKASIGTTLAVIGGCFAAIAAAAIINTSNPSHVRAYARTPRRAA